MNKTPKSVSLTPLINTLTTMTPRSKAFKLIRAELKRRGHWKNKPRGKPVLANLHKHNEESICE